MKTGLEILCDQRLDLLAGRRVGLLAHPASVDRRLRHAADLIRALPGNPLKNLFGPEHGIRGEAQDMEGLAHSTDPSTGLPVFSLYGQDAASLAPTAEMLEEIDLLVADLQDIGARYYTFIHTLSLCMEACAKLSKPVIVLDRPNPLGGASVEGNIPDPAFLSFVGRFPLPARHGMTMGELARLFNETHDIRCDLTVIPMSGWRREQWFDRTGLPWIMPSPNMPTLDTATVYPGTCLLEGTNISEGRGTTRPFELVGAPWIEPFQWTRALETKPLPGVAFRPAYFSPTFHKWRDQVCGAVQIRVTDRNAFKPFLTGLALVLTARRLWPEAFDWRREPYEFEQDRFAFDLLAGTDSMRTMIEANIPLLEMEKSWQEDLEEFLKKRKRFLLY